MDAVGTLVGGYRITEQLWVGAWDIYRGHPAEGSGRAIITITTEPPPDTTLAALALPFDLVPALIAATPLDDKRFAIIEREPVGWTIGELKWPLPIDEVISVGLDLARVLQRMHAVGTIHGALRPQTTWIDKTSRLTGTTPRPELAGLHCIKPTLSGCYSPFINDIFCPDVIARNEPRSVSSDVAQLGMMLHRMATRESPFRRPNESFVHQTVRSLESDIPRWPNDDVRARSLEALARSAFDPAHAKTRSLDTVLAGLERLAR